MIDIVVVGLSGALIIACVRALRAEWLAAPTSWRLIALSGLPLVAGGAGFALRFWVPTPGPYRANELYPLGPYLNAWAVSFGFMWLAFGLLLYCLALQTPRTWRLWITLLVAFVVAWLPHGVIGIGFALAGHNEPSIQLYTDWASRLPGLISLVTSVLLMLAHFGCAAVGFGLTGLQLQRTKT